MISETAKQFIFESLCYFARVDEINARQMTMSYIDRGILTDQQVVEIMNILASGSSDSEANM